MNDTALIIFAREPKLGRVKTRLMTNLSPKTILKLYQALVKDTIQVARSIPCQNRYLFFTGCKTAPILKRLAPSFTFRQQRGENLGLRMLHAFNFAKKQGAKHIITIGTDCPTLTKDDIHTATRKLINHDYVLGPAKDGGYYLLGLKKPDKRIFYGIRWGSEEVLKETLAKIKSNKNTVTLLRQQTDIDTFESLIKSTKLIVKKNTAPYTKAVLKEIALHD